LALAAEVILYAAQNQRATKKPLALLKIRAGQPMRTDNSVIERLCSLVIIDGAAESEAHSSDTTLGASPQIYANQRCGLKTPGSLLANLADDCLEQRLPVLDVSGGLIEDESLVDPLLHYEKATVAFGNGGNGDFGACWRACP